MDMTKNCSRVLTSALALSLLIHLIFAAVIKPIRSVEAASEQEASRVRIVVIHTPPPATPTPQPTHPPKAQSHPQNNRRSQIKAPRARAHSDRGPSEPRVPESISNVTPGPDVPVPSAAPGTPEPTPTPKPACSVPNVPATTVTVISPTVPDELGNNLDAQAQVRVTLQPSGAVEAVEIYRTAGNALLDHEAMRAARQSTYRAEIRDCVPIRGDYLFTVDFKG
jgi:TonB family protein